MVTLNIDPYSGGGSCLMPAPGDDGRPLRRAVESDEAGCWLRLFLGEAAKRSDSVRKLSSHSLKSTMLSFAAKRGYSHTDRLSMGHHVHPFKMADVYARDAQARDLRLLDSLIAEIRSKTFMPDESRAGRMASPKKQKTPGAFQKTLDDSSFSLVEGIGAEASESERQEDRLLVPRCFYPPKAPDGYSFVRHSRSKMLHYLGHDRVNVLACGRLKTDSYEAALNLRYDSAVCHACQVAVSKA